MHFLTSIINGLVDQGRDTAIDLLPDLRRLLHWMERRLRSVQRQLNASQRTLEGAQRALRKLREDYRFLKRVLELIRDLTGWSADLAWLDEGFEVVECSPRAWETTVVRELERAEDWLKTSILWTKRAVRLLEEAEGR